MQYNCCVCHKKATWDYAPSVDVLQFFNKFYCDEHVPRGCSCSTDEEGNYLIDEQGRELPCVEYFYNEEGHCVQEYDYSYIILNAIHQNNNSMYHYFTEVNSYINNELAKKHVEYLMQKYAAVVLEKGIEAGYIVVDKSKLPHDILK